jgi:protein TonB
LLPLRGLAPALLLHGGIAWMLVTMGPAPQPPAPVFEILLQPAAAAPETPVSEAPLSDAAPMETAPPEPAIETLPDPAPPRPRHRPQRSTTPAAANTTANPESMSAPTAMPVPAAAPATSPAPAEYTPPPYAPVLLGWLVRHRDYPRAARLRRQEGTPRIAITLDMSGRLLALTLTESSGFALLDEAALDMARRAAPFPPPQFPRGTDRATFIVPVQFTLQR